MNGMSNLGVKLQAEHFFPNIRNGWLEISNKEQLLC